MLGLDLFSIMRLTGGWKGDTVIYDSRVKKVKVSEGIVDLGLGAFWCCVKLEHVTLPESLEAIGYEAFACCKSLNNINIGSSVQSIESGAFRGCESLTDVYYSGTKEQWGSIKIESSGNVAILSATIHSADGQEFLGDGMG